MSLLRREARGCPKGEDGDKLCHTVAQKKVEDDFNHQGQHLGIQDWDRDRDRDGEVQMDLLFLGLNMPR